MYYYLDSIVSSTMADVSGKTELARNYKMVLQKSCYQYFLRSADITFHFLIHWSRTMAIKSWAWVFFLLFHVLLLFSMSMFT